METKTMLVEKVKEYGIVSGDKYYSVYDKLDQLKPGMLIEATVAESKKTPGSLYIKGVTIKGDAPVVAAKAPAPEAAPAPIVKKEFKKFAPRKEEKKDVNWDKIAMGKVRCAAAEAALKSPIVAQLCLGVEGLEKAIEVAEQAANWLVEYTFREDKKDSRGE